MEELNFPANVDDSVHPFAKDTPLALVPVYGKRSLILVDSVNSTGVC